MPDEIPLRIALILSIGSFLAVRVYYRVKTGTLGKDSVPQDNKVALGILLFILILSFLSMVMWLMNPHWLTWSAVPLPGWVRWAGAGLALASAPFLHWVHRTLGASYSAKLEIKEQHKLVTTGPYRWVRHPMYSAIFLWTAGLSLLMVNWIVFLLPLAFALFAILRVPDEEKMMVEEYGDEYREYTKHAGRFLPRWLALRKLQ